MSGVVHITNPCHESWEAMQPQNNGRFCDACCKVVVDFTDYTNTEILDYLKAKTNERICGRFNVTQVHQPNPDHSISLHRKEKLWRLQKFAAALFIAFGSLLFTSCSADVVGKTKILGDSLIFDQFDQLPKDIEIDTVKSKDTIKNNNEPEIKPTGDIHPIQLIQGTVAYSDHPFPGDSSSINQPQ